jgi:hypothetical protein
MAAGCQQRSEPPFSPVDCSSLHWCLASTFFLSVLLGLVFGLPSAANEVEVKARCMAVHSDVVGGAALVMPMHPKVSAPPLSPLGRADLDWGPVTMRCDRGGCACAFLGAATPVASLRSGWMARRCCSPHIYVDGEA